jgi:Mn2+/Fe2+ NRAMP family transporter
MRLRFDKAAILTWFKFRLFPSLPIYAGVLITAADVLILLVFFSSDQGKKGMMMFEIVIVCLVRADHSSVSPR